MQLKGLYAEAIEGGVLRDWAQCRDPPASSPGGGGRLGVFEDATPGRGGGVLCPRMWTPHSTNRVLQHVLPRRVQLLPCAQATGMLIARATAAHVFPRIREPGGTNRDAGPIPPTLTRRSPTAVACARRRNAVLARVSFSSNPRAEGVHSAGTRGAAVYALQSSLQQFDSSGAGCMS